MPASERPIRPAAPDVAGVEPTDICQPDDIDVDVSRVVWVNQRVLGGELDRPEIVDLSAEGCDFSGITATGANMRRIRIAASRLRDCTFGGGVLQDAVLDECTSLRLSLRFATLQRVIVTTSTMTELDLYGATLDHVLFRDCDLSGAMFRDVTVKNARFERCSFAGVHGATSLRGADVDLDDLITMGPSLAREAGLRLH
ncbi:MAG: pentapeptide repeat-containing protein [Frankiaceae bacterium]|nr:pentapeptide repeat-containing protein [Frankiaceae bacterium]MBV9368643.1 pentapeptide repeat-containing protein [Frankiales bacterium]